MAEDILDSVHINFGTETLWLLNLALALVMFGIALEISVNDFGQLLKRPKPVVVGIVSQFLLLPALTFLLVLFTEPLPSLALGMFMVAACPGGNISNFITHLAKGNSALSISLTAIATLIAVVMTPLNLQLWGSLYGPTASLMKEVAISSWEMIQVVSLLLGVPLLLGIYVNYLRPRFAQKMARILKMVSLIFFILLIFIALYDNRGIFADYIFYVFWLVVLHNTTAFLAGFSFSRVCGLSVRDTRSVTIETGIQNSGLGLLLIFTFFDGMGGMALLAAFWGIWHLISGLLLALFWGYRPVIKEGLV